MSSASSYDCLVIGGGPAGSTVASLVAASGARTLLVEREKFPRFHVGEVVLPAARETLTRLGLWDQLSSGPFLSSGGVQFVSGCGRELLPLLFGDAPSGEKKQAWHVDRSEFDQLLLENAVARGAECREQTRVLEVLFDGARAGGVRLQTQGETEETIDARVIVDASGQQSLIAAQLDLRRLNAELRKAAIWGYYQAARRAPGERGALSTIFCTRTRDAWFWYLPLAGDVTSVGVVGDADYLIKGRGRPANVLEEELVNCPAVTERLASARLISKFHVARDFAYDTSCPSGNGWLLVGDAWGFLDPLFSSGVWLALKSGELAADALIGALETNDLTAVRLGAWDASFRVGVARMRKLVHAFYTKEFSFGDFLSEHPQAQTPLTRLLAGELFEPQADELFEILQPWLDRVSRKPVEVD